MARSYPWNKWFTRKFLSRWFAARKAPARPGPRFRPAVEGLCDRVVPAVTAVFAGGTLIVTGDDLANNIVVRSDVPNGQHVVPGVVIQGGPARLANTTKIEVFGFGGGDTIDVHELATGGLVFPVAIDAGAGADVVIGSDGRDAITGGTENDEIDGGRDNDVIQGDAGNDTLQGGLGTDTISGGEEVNDADVLREAGNTNFTLTQSQLIGGGFFGTDTVAGMERWLLTGGDGNNVLDAENAFGEGTLVGGLGDDTLAGGDFLDVLEGGGGNDTLDSGGFADDTVVATATASGSFVLTNTQLTAPGLGTDTLIGAINLAQLTGASGADTFAVSNFDGEVTVNGGLGNDRLVNTLVGPANPSSMTLNASFLLRSSGGNVRHISVEFATLSGNSLGNRIDASGFGGAGVTIVGNDGNDTLIGSAGADNIQGNDGDDTITGSFGQDVINGGAGIDTLNDGFGSTTNKTITLTNFTSSSGQLKVTDNGSTDIDNFFNRDRANISVATGQNTINASGASFPVTLTGGSGNDNLLGGSAADVINGGGGNDTIQGGAGPDLLNGGDNDDSLFGFTIGDFTDGASDVMNGDAGNDFGSGQDAGDAFFQGTGTGGLVVQGTDGDDVIVIRRRVTAGGPEAVLQINGVESAVRYSNGQTIRVFAGKGNDVVVMDESTAVTWSSQLYGEAGNDTLIGASRGDLLDGGNGKDALLGLGGDDTLVGGKGDDALNGGAGADLLLGEDGNDALDGGAGSDTMIDGAGKDSFEAQDGEVDYLFVDSADKKNRDPLDIVLES